MDVFFRTQAGQNQRRGSSRTWVLRRPDDRPELPRVLGFYTLTLGSLERASLPGTISKGLPPRYPVPVIILGRLARHVRVRGQGYGERLLLDAHDRALEISEHAGGVAVVVDAKDEAAAVFYARFGYQALESLTEGLWPRRMLLALADIRKANEEAADE
ncbi:GNAT family N-acetyltransferase [Archangium violaceum]|nr:GNAT family N-acetyltransferase [Archangium gephyra]